MTKRKSSCGRKSLTGSARIQIAERLMLGIERNAASAVTIRIAVSFLGTTHCRRTMVCRNPVLTMSRRPRVRRYEWFRDTDGAVLKVDMETLRYTEAANGNGVAGFYMRPCWRNHVRCEVSTATLSVLPKTRARNPKPVPQGRK